MYGTKETKTLAAERVKDLNTEANLNHFSTMVIKLTDKDVRFRRVAHSSI